jgi:hypothetical protein
MKPLTALFLAAAILFAVSGAAQASQVIPLPSGFTGGFGRAINESDQEVGVMWYDPDPSTTSPIHPFAPFIYYNNGGTAQVLKGYDPKLDYETRDLSNDAQLVVGYIRDSATAWVWDSTRLFTALPSVGYIEAYAVKVVDETNGLILGLGLKPDSSSYEYIQWKLDGSNWILTAQGNDLSRGFNSNNINSSGHHSASVFSSGWDPMIKSQVPEPGSLLLLGLGFLGLGIYAQRRWTRKS